MKRVLYHLSLLIIFLFNLQGNLLFAEKNIFIKINYLKPEGGFSKSEEAVIDQLIDEFIERGYQIGEAPEWQILVGIYHQGQNKVLITYTIMQSLPKPIIKFGAKNQVFYLMMDEKEDVGEKNQEIRENLTADFLHQFAMLIDIKHKIVDEPNLEKGISVIVSDIIGIIGKVQR